MTLNLQKPDITELKPRITVFGVGGGGGNAVNNMINLGLEGVEFVVANTDAQALTISRAERVIQLGAAATQGLGAGSHPEVGSAAAEECLDEILDHIGDSHMVFITCGMGGGTGTGAAPVIARAARERGLLTVGVVTKPFHFEGQRRMRIANAGIDELQRSVDTLIVIPNQNLFRIANEKTTFADAFAMADQVLYSGVASITDLMVREGLINLDFADVRSVMHDMGRAMMGTGEASDEGRALKAAEAAIANPLLDETSMRGARGLLISITGGPDMTLFEVDEAANRIREEVDPDANVIFGATTDAALAGLIRVSVVATGIERTAGEENPPTNSATPRPTPKQTHSPAVPSQEARSEESQSELFVEVMEALEEEMSVEVEEDFQPQSQIFTKPVAEASVAAQAARAQPLGLPPHAVAAQASSAAASRMAPQQPAHAQNARQVQNHGRGHAQAAVSSAASDQVTAQAAVQMASQAATQVAHDYQPESAQTPQARRGTTGKNIASSSVSRIPDIEDFPPLLRQNIRQKADGEMDVGQGPRKLWHKLTQSLIQREGEVPPARLEPAAPTDMGQEGADHGAMPAQAATMPASRRAQPAAPTAYSEEEQLEIPAFLRRQVN